MKNVPDYLPFIRRIARLYHTSFLEPDDLVQEACLALLEHPSTALSDQELQRVINLAMVHAIRRYESPSVVRLLPEHDNIADPSAASFADPSAEDLFDPDSSTPDGSPCLADLEALMDLVGLSPRQRQVLSLHYGLDGSPALSVDEVAARLGLRPRSIESIIYRSKLKLQEKVSLVF